MPCTVTHGVSGPEQRLDVHNGLLLSALWDAAFDSGLVSFANDGTILVKDILGKEACVALGLSEPIRLYGLRDQHRANLSEHRAKHGF
jgi:putative restriction endonuclease